MYVGNVGWELHRKIGSLKEETTKFQALKITNICSPYYMDLGNTVKHNIRPEDMTKTDP